MCLFIVVIDCQDCYFLVVFFFFKQKTSYEMRISDWSSDVCSSDLQAVSVALRDAGVPGIKYLDAGSRDRGDGSYNYVIFDDRLVEILSFEQTFGEETGRASCRERVCQYV